MMKLDTWLQSRAHRRRAKKALYISVALTLLLYVIPFGNFIAYPLMLFSTVVHELGHGLASIAVGGSFKQMVVFADGSGVASHTDAGGGISRALVSAGGLVGPAVVAGLAFALGRREKVARVTLGVGAVFLAIVTAVFMRNPFGIVFTSVIALGMGWVAWRQSAEVAQLALVFLAVQLSLSVFSRADYLFVSEAHTGAGVMPSDTAHMAIALGGSYWMWGLACGAFSIAVLGAGIWLFSRAFRDET